MCCFLDLKPRRIECRQEKQGQQGSHNQATHNRNRHRTKKILRDNGIIASTAASAVNTIGRKRRMVAPIDRIPRLMPSLNVLLNLVNQDQRVTHDHSR